MNSLRTAASILAIFAGSASTARAAGLADLPIDVSGTLRFDKRLIVETDKGALVYEGVPQFPMYHQAFLQLKARPSEHVEAKLSGVLRYYDFMVVKELSGCRRAKSSSRSSLCSGRPTSTSSGWAPTGSTCASVSSASPGGPPTGSTPPTT